MPLPAPWDYISALEQDVKKDPVASIHIISAEPYTVRPVKALAKTAQRRLYTEPTVRRWPTQVGAPIFSPTQDQSLQARFAPRRFSRPGHCVPLCSIRGWPSPFARSRRLEVARKLKSQCSGRKRR